MNDDYFLQVSFAKQLGQRLERFRVKKESPFLAAARCPVCNEGTSKTKTRFVFYEKEHQINVMCFNCGLSTTLASFLKTHHRPLFDEFKFDKFRTNSFVPSTVTHSVSDFVPKKIELAKSEDSLNLQLVSDLPSDHPARKYIDSRNLPDFPFYYAPKFFAFSSRYNTEFKSNSKDEPRIIIPFFDKRGKIFAYQGRDLSGIAKQKYITVKVDPKAPLLFGLKALNLSQPINLVEGPIDSLLLPNCVASVNASLASTAEWLLRGINKTPEILTIILDNESRNKAVCAEYEKAINSGYRIVIWPEKIKQKDINEMLLAGLDPMTIIKKNTFSGLEAKLKFYEWKRV